MGESFFGGIIFLVLLIGLIIGATFEANFVAGVVVASMVGTLVLIFLAAGVYYIVLQNKEAAKARITAMNARTEKMISSIRFKDCTKWMLSNAIVERHYPADIIDDKPNKASHKKTIKDMLAEAVFESHYPDASGAGNIATEPEDVCGLQVSDNPETEALKIGTHTAASLCEYLDTLHDECMKEENSPAQQAPASPVQNTPVIKPYKPVRYVPADEDEEDEEEDDYWRMNPYEDPVEKSEWDMYEQDEVEKWVDSLFGVNED